MKVSLLLFLALSAASCFASTNCISNYNAGTSVAPVAFCITENGNVLRFVAGQLLIDGAEGYGFCNTATGIDYFDIGAYGDSGNWQPSVVTQPNGPDTFPLTISRATSDNLFSLVQSYAFSSGKKGVKVTMTATGIGDVRLFRYADVQNEVVGGFEFGAQTYRSAFIWSQPGVGLMMSPTPSPYGGSEIVLGGANNFCHPATPAVVPYKGDSALLTGWLLLKSRKRTASFEYLPMW